MQMAQHQAEIRNAQRQVDFQNAKSLWDADFQNRNLMYENQLKQYGLSRPQVHSAADGVIITSQNPDGSSKVEFMNTKPHFEHLESQGKFMTGMGLDPTMVQLQGLRSMNLPPPLEQYYAQQLAIRDVVGRGLGGQTFGSKYKDAEKAVDARMKANEYEMLRNTKPAEYIKLRQEYIAAELHNRFISSGDNSWLTQLGKTASPFLLP